RAYRERRESSVWEHTGRSRSREPDQRLMIPDQYILINRETDMPQSVYMGVSSHDQLFFGSPSSARTSNCHGLYKDRTKYRVARVRIEIVEDDVDPATDEDVRRAEEMAELDRRIDAEIEANGI